MLFTAGVSFQFYIPLIPYILFTFGGIAWFIAVIEAMVAAPIVALGVTHPEGQNETFGKSEQAIWLLLNIFLRPGMMVIGLIAGIILSYVGIWLLDAGFLIAAGGAIGFTLGSGIVVGFFALLVIYFSMVVAIVTKAFSLIHILPDKILRWLSGGYAEQLGQETAGMLAEVKGPVSEAGKQIGGAFQKQGERPKEQPVTADKGSDSAGGGGEEKPKEEEPPPGGTPGGGGMGAGGGG